MHHPDETELKYYIVLRDFQVAVGFTMMALSFIQMTHTLFRFIELAEEDRELFANCQRSARGDFREKLLEDAVKNYTLVGLEDLEMKRCEKPQ